MYAVGQNGVRRIKWCVRIWRRGWRSITAPSIAPARSPLVEAYAQQLIAPEAVEAIPELEFDQTASLTAEAGHDRLVADAGTHAHAEPVLELEFDQTLGW